MTSQGGQLQSQRTLPTIHMFWHGPPLSRVERLCLASFARNGHPVELHVYEPPPHVPAGIRIRDAAEILPRDALFLHKRTGSVGLFSDWFRYKLLFERGGVWADTDVVCLAPFDYASELIFGWQDFRWLNNAVLGTPAGHELARWMVQCCENPNRVLPYDGLRMKLRKWKRRYLQGDRRERVRWGEYGPKGLTLAARHLGWSDQARPVDELYPVHWDQWHSVFEATAPQIPAVSRAIHLWHNKMRERPGFDKNGVFPRDSLFERLVQRYESDSMPRFRTSS